MASCNFLLSSGEVKQTKNKTISATTQIFVKLTDNVYCCSVEYNYTYQHNGNGQDSNVVIISQGENCRFIIRDDS